jgi:hypothetical protein
VLLKPLNSGDNTMSFCEQFPLIARCDDGLVAVIVRQGETVNTDALERLVKNYNCDGLARIVVIAVSDDARMTTENRKIRGCEFQIIQCNQDQFSGCYAERSTAAR